MRELVHDAEAAFDNAKAVLDRRIERYDSLGSDDRRWALRAYEARSTIAERVWRARRAIGRARRPI